jgi:molecular chaperone DnaK (HSP70)
MDSNGMLFVSTEDKATNENASIVIIIYGARLREVKCEEKMWNLVMEHKLMWYGQEMKESVMAKKKYENCLASLKEHIKDENRAADLSAEDKEKGTKVVAKEFKWPDEEPRREQSKDLQEALTPIIGQAEAGPVGGATGAAGGAAGAGEPQTPHHDA